MARLREEAAKAAPHEACGLLLGQRLPDGGECIDEARHAANVASDPARFFEIDPTALLAAHRDERAGGAQILGYYHSHPTGRAAPSATDREHSTGDGRIWAIICGPEVAFWRDTANGFVPLDTCRGSAPD